MVKEKNNQLKKIKRPWPTKAAMEQVYSKNFWGGPPATFYSGQGSHDRHIIHPYLDVVRAFLNAFEKPLVVCDLGCGDFNVGKGLVTHAGRYIAVDIVDALIVHLKQRFTAPNLEFQQLDIAGDNLPLGDCALVRQVLQHLSNAEIQRILPKLKAYTYLIVTEHIPTGNFEPNLDIIAGQGTRLKKGSGVDLLAAPFDFKVKAEKLLLSVPLEGDLGVIVTKLYQV